MRTTLLVALFLLPASGCGESKQTKIARVREDFRAIEEAVAKYEKLHGERPLLLRLLTENGPKGEPPLLQPLQIRPPWGEIRHEYGYSPENKESGRKRDRPDLWFKFPVVEGGRGGDRVTSWD